MSIGFERLYRSAPCGLLTIHVSGEIVNVNDTLLEWTGYDDDQLVGANFLSLLDAGSRIFFETRHTQMLHLQGYVKEVALTIRKADGLHLPVLLNSVLAPDTHPARVHIAVFDATDRREYEAELLRARRSAESSEERVRVLQRMSSLLEATVSDHDVAHAFADVAREAFAATEAAVFLRDTDGVLHLGAGANPLAEFVPPIEALRNTPVEIVVHADEVGVQYPTLAAGLRAARLETLTIMPLQSEKERLGVLVCFFGRRREFDERSFELQRALGRQASQALVRARLQRELEFLALHDPLTGLANRQLLQQELDLALERAQSTRGPVAIVFLDVDDFKRVNDQWGHAVGDAVLHELAARLRAGVRGDDVVGRIGGDEFVVICADTDLEASVVIADRVLELGRQPIDVGDAVIELSLSAGVTTFDPTRDAQTAGDELLIRADGAMYHSKRAGKNQVTRAP